jgi:hypothetical protein
MAVSWRAPITLERVLQNQQPGGALAAYLEVDPTDAEPSMLAKLIDPRRYEHRARRLDLNIVTAAHTALS